MTKTVDMLNGSLWNKILLFALPLAASSVLQQLFNSADAAVVGRYCGHQALAAVGSNGPVINIIITLFIGLSTGANVVIANLLGQQKKEETQEAVHTAISVSLISGILLIFIGGFFAKPILSFMNTPDDVINLATLYLRIYFSGMPFVMLYNFGSAILRSKGDTKRPLISLIVSGIINVILNLVLVIVFNLGVAGVALSTVISNVVSSLIIFYFLCNEEDAVRVNIKKLSVRKKYFYKMLKIGIPAGIQGMMFSISNITIQSAINSFGSSAMAGSASELNYEYYCYFIVMAFNQASISFTSQNYGAGKYDRCKKVFFLCILSSTLITGFLDAIFVIFRNFFIGIYTPEQEAIRFGVTRMAIALSCHWLINSYEISAATLRAIGHSLLPAVLTTFGVCVLRVVWVSTIFRRFRDFKVLIAAYPVSWIITGTALLISYAIITGKLYKNSSKTSLMTNF